MVKRAFDEMTSLSSRQRRFLKENIWNIFQSALVLFCLSYSWMFSEITVPNERTRVYLSLAIVDNGTFAIDGPVKRFGRTIDIAGHDGRYYTDKAPGAGFLGAILYGVCRIFTEPQDWSIPELVNLMRTWLMIPIGLAGFLLLRKTMSILGVGPRAVDIVSIGWILGTAAFHYSTAFFGHQIVATAFILALFLIETGTQTDRTALGWLRFMGAGAALGIAGITEYQAAAPCALFAIYAVFKAKMQMPRLVSFIFSALFFLCILLAYNSLAFGGPFELSYHHLANRAVQDLHSEGIAGVTLPNAEAFLGSTLSLHRGIVATSPFFVFFPIGLLVMWKRKMKPLCIITGIAAFYFLFFIWSAKMWYGGWGFGPRLLVPSMVLICIPLGFFYERFEKNTLLSGVFAGLVIYGLLYNQTIHLVFPELPESAKNPIIDAVIPAVNAGILSPNLMSKLFGALQLWTAIPGAIAALLAAGIIGFSGAKTIDSYKRRAIYIAILVSTLAISTVPIWLTGETWKKNNQAHFVENMKKYERSELTQ